MIYDLLSIYVRPDGDGDPEEIGVKQTVGFFCT